MSPKTKSKLHFTTMPRDYAGLCKLLIPRPIHDKSDYANVIEVTDAMAVHAEEFTPDQEDYFDLLCQLIESWEDEHVKWKKLTPLQMLKFLMEEHTMSGADLSRLLGASRHLGPMILRGEREITAAHARTLGAHFALPAGAFIE